MKLKYPVCLAVFLVIFYCLGNAGADVGVNIVVANPSDDDTREVSVNYELPPGLQRGDIIETGTLKVEYDVAKSLFYVTGEIELKPKETRTVKVVIRDIWNISDEKFRNISEMLDGKVKSLEQSVDADALKLASDELRSRLNSVQQYQQENAGNVQKRMEMYTSNMDKIRRIENDVFSLERIIKKEVSGAEKEESVVLTIEASNPMDEEKKLPVRYDLPREIIPQYIEEPGKMEIMHDVTKDMFYLFSEETFGPQETKRFQVRIKNVWRISESEIKGYVDEAEAMHPKFAGLPEERTADMLLASIKQNATMILESQSAAESVKDRVAVFRENQNRLRGIKDDLEKMKSLTIPEIDKEKAELSDVLRAEKIFETLKELSDKLFKEKLTAATVWRIIMIVVIFAIILTAIFYALWILKMNREESRTYDKMG